MAKQNAKALSLIICLFFISTSALAQDSLSLAGAKSEGQVVFYGSAALPLIQAVGKAFEKKYPFLEVDVTRSPAETLVNKIRTEKLAGKKLFDVVWGSTVPFLVALKVLGPYSSPEASAYPSKFKHPDGLWTGASANYYVIGYNTKMVSREEAPKNWEDLLDPKWRGKIGMDPEEYAWLGAMEAYLGEESAQKLMTGLARQNIQWRKNHPTLVLFMASGEYALIVSYAHNIQAMKNKGATVDWVKTTRPIVADIQGVAISAQPPHPSAARLLKDFLLSDEGQRIILEDGKVPLRPGVLPAGSPFQPSGLELYPTPSRVITNLNHFAAKFNEIFGPRS